MEVPLCLNVSQTCMFPLCLGATAVRRDVFQRFSNFLAEKSIEIYPLY